MNDNTPSDESSRSRRDFLKASTTAAVGGAIASSIILPRNAHAGVDDTLKIGLVGCGGRGGGATKDALVSTGNVRLVAMADAFEDNLQNKRRQLMEDKELASIKDRIDVPLDRCYVGFDAYKQVLASDIDVVILATPPGFRPIHFAAAVEAGKNIFMEKPVAVDAPGIRKVLAAAKEARKKKLAVGVGLQRHHQNVYIETMKRLKDGAIGDISYMRAYWNGITPWIRARKPGQTEMEYQMRNWYFFNWLCGDHITEQHIHNLDVINWLKEGHPVKANGMGGRQVRTGRDTSEIFDHHFVEFEYEDGSRCYSQCRHIAGCFNSVSEHAHGTKGSVNIGAGRITGDNAWRYRGRGDISPYRQEHNDLYAAIRSGNPYVEAEYGAISTMTSIFGRMATYSGKALNWDDAINSNIDLAPENYAWDAMPQVLPGPDGYYPHANPGTSIVV